MKSRFKLDAGEKFSRVPNEPIISVLHDGPRSYIWIGNDADGDKFCFATLSGQKTLEKLANEILSALKKKQAA